MLGCLLHHALQRLGGWEDARFSLRLPIGRRNEPVDVGSLPALTNVPLPTCKYTWRRVRRMLVSRRPCRADGALRRRVLSAGTGRRRLRSVTRDRDRPHGADSPGVAHLADAPSTERRSKRDTPPEPTAPGPCAGAHPALGGLLRGVVVPCSHFSRSPATKSRGSRRE